jgi:hypothetical protein
MVRQTRAFLRQSAAGVPPPAPATNLGRVFNPFLERQAALSPTRF